MPTPDYHDICYFFLTQAKALQDEFYQSSEWSQVQSYNAITYIYLGEDGEKKKWKFIKNGYGVLTCIYTGDEADKENGLVGTDGCTVIKYVNQDDYDFIKTEDFIERGMLPIDAMLHEFILKKYGFSETELSPWLQPLKEELKQNLLVDCYLDIGKMKDTANNIAYFKKRRELAKNLIAKVVLRLAQKLQEKNADVNLKTIISDIELAEKLHIAKQGRPHFIKVGSLSQNDKKMISAQFTKGEVTIPSSYRLRELDQKAELSGYAKAMLSNHVVDFTAVTDHQNKIEPLVEMIGHSSYPPIGVQDEMTRRYLTYQAVLENLKQIAKDKFMQMSEQEFSDEFKDNSVDKPYVIKLSTMMVLTPFGEKNIDKLLRGGESEHAQLSESYTALQLAAQELHQIEVNGKKYYIKLDSNTMNIPVNVKSIGQTILSEHYLQEKVNLKGFYEYINHVENFLNISALPADVADLYIKVRGALNANKITIIDNMLKTAKNSNAELAILQQESYRWLKKYVETSDVNIRSECETQYRKLREKILKLEQNFYSAYHALNKKRASLFEGQKKQIENLQQKIRQHLSKSQVDKNALTLLSRYLKVQALFYSKDYQEKLYELQVNFLLSSAQMGREIESFCKSAEDRTGWLRITLLAYQAFDQQYGYDPDLDNAYHKAIFQDLIRSARQLSAAIENTEANARARGTQVDRLMAPDDNDISREMATMAKQVIQAAHKMAGGLRTPKTVMTNYRKKVNFLSEQSVEQIKLFCSQRDLALSAGEQNLQIQNKALPEHQLSVKKKAISTTDASQQTFEEMIDLFFVLHPGNKIDITVLDNDVKKEMEKACEAKGLKAGKDFQIIVLPANVNKSVSEPAQPEATSSPLHQKAQ